MRFYYFSHIKKKKTSANGLDVAWNSKAMDISVRKERNILSL